MRDDKSFPKKKDQQAGGRGAPLDILKRDREGWGVNLRRGNRHRVYPRQQIHWEWVYKPKVADNGPTINTR